MVDRQKRFSDQHKSSNTATHVTQPTHQEAIQPLVIKTQRLLRYIKLDTERLSCLTLKLGVPYRKTHPQIEAFVLSSPVPSSGTFSRLSSVTGRER